MQDVDVAYTDQPEVPRKFIPALVAGLAYELAVKNPPKYQLSPQGEQILVAGVPMEVRMSLKGDYQEKFARADQEDAERSSWFVLPSVR